MRIPCSSCGRATVVTADSGEVDFDCPHCGKRNHVRLIAAAPERSGVQPPVNRPTRPFTPAPSRTGAYKKVLVSLMVLGALAALIHPGTFATFNATTQSPNNITSGTLLLDSNYNNADCISSSTGTISATNSNTTCTAVLTIPAGTTSVVSVPIKLKNIGNINASQLLVGATSTSCAATSGAGVATYNLSNSTTLTTALTNGQTGIISLAVTALPIAVTSGNSIRLTNGSSTQTVTASANAAVNATSISVNSFTANAAYAVGSEVVDTTTWTSTTYGGNTANNLCQSTELMAAETNSSFTATSGYGCMWGNNVNGTITGCTLDSSHLADSSTTTQSYTFNCTYNNASGLCSTPSVAHQAATGLNAGATRYFLFAAQISAPPDNSYQGLTTSFNLTFELIQ